MMVIEVWWALNCGSCASGASLRRINESHGDVQLLSEATTRCNASSIHVVSTILA